MSWGSLTTDRRARGLSAAIVLVSVLPLASMSQVPTARDPPSDLSVRLQSPGGNPVEGALVALLDARDSVVAEGLSTEGGTRVLRAPTGAYRVRVRRIGYLPFISQAIVLPRTEELHLVVETPNVVLNNVVITASSPCRQNEPTSQALGVVWDEIDKALRASQLTIQDLSGFGRGQVYHREIRPDGGVLSSDTTHFAITNRRPFGAVHPDTLAKNGYVLGDEFSGWHYFAPDETVLLSERFAATHCFRLVRDRARPGEIGVSFEPIPQRKVADIAGVLWLDERTAELREVVFRYVNAGVLSRFNAGGFTRFLRVPSGAWIVDEWQLRVPRLEKRHSLMLPPQFFVIGYYENGGGILLGRTANALQGKR